MWHVNLTDRSGHIQNLAEIKGHQLPRHLPIKAAKQQDKPYASLRAVLGTFFFRDRGNCQGVAVYTFTTDTDQETSERFEIWKKTI